MTDTNEQGAVGAATGTDATKEGAAPVDTGGKPDGGTPADPSAKPAGGDGKPAGTLIEGDGGDDKPVAGDWPADWREKLAGGDEKELKRLQRFQSPLDVGKAYRELEKKLSSGKAREPLPEGATDEQVAAWRKANGIPETPDGYLQKLPDGLVIGDADKPLVQDFLARVHGKNVDPAFVAEALDWWHGMNEKAAAERAMADKEFRAKAADALRAEWGAEFRPNLNAALNFLDSAPPMDDGTPLKEALLGARLADGSLFGDNPAALRWLARLASDANPAGFVAPSAGGSQAQSVDDEIASIKALMASNSPKYWKDEKMQARYRQLLEAQDKLKARG